MEALLLDKHHQPSDVKELNEQQVTAVRGNSSILCWRTFPKRAGIFPPTLAW